MKKIVLTGGGTAGHVTPNFALLPKLNELGYEVTYMGSLDGIEKKLVEEKNIPYYGVPVGKLRRYFDPKNFSDPFKVIKGYKMAKKYLKEINPDVVFSKGGYVSVPVVRAAASLKIPCIIHESDFTPGLANKLCIPKATKVCCNFPETLAKLPNKKAVLTGSPVREELFTGNADIGRSLCNFNSDKPVILVMGGSTGAMAINKVVRASLFELLKDFQIVHLCGKGKLDNMLLTTEGYAQFEYLNDDLKHVMAMSDIVISRAGANAICEFLSLKKPALLIPLSKAASRGDQILNANSFKAQGFSMVVEEEDLDEKVLITKVHELYENKDKFIEAMNQSNQLDSIDKIISLIEEAANK